MDVFNARELCLVPDLVIPLDFKAPRFIQYDSTSCPRVHLTMFCRKMKGYLKNEKLLIHYFHDSLAGPAVVWYNRLSRKQIQSWSDLASAFLGQYRYALDLALTRKFLQGMRMRPNETFKEYALRWRSLAEQVQPPIIEEEMTPLFHAALPIPFFDRLLEKSRSRFEDFMKIGERIDYAIQEGKLDFKSKYQTEEVEEGEINECRFQSPRNLKRGRTADSSEPSRKIPRTSANLEVF
ncbi:hypothetical protein HRI_004750300 [Hibiscus trionum]|uniref:Retrotransposon gag domain-containing protein n=1 Tax=Hibiscus trionum TaxID=183268 RepID=A0A9W7MVD0_HIBTR|nr:hypothetical protein HRI_004750300 [Hibiscus trionum]